MISLKSQPTICGNTTAQNLTPGTPPTCPMEDCRQGNARDSPIMMYNLYKPLFPDSLPCVLHGQ